MSLLDRLLRRERGLTHKIKRRRRKGAKSPKAKAKRRSLRARIRKMRRNMRQRAWGGSKWIVVREVRPVVARHGIARTSAKRRATFGNPGSDHHISQLTAYAEDYATANNHSLADEIGRELGIGNVTDYTHYFIERRFFRRKCTYRVQIIAGTHGTGPHLHVGVRRV